MVASGAKRSSSGPLALSWLRSPPDLYQASMRGHRAAVKHRQRMSLLLQCIHDEPPDETIPANQKNAQPGSPNLIGHSLADGLIECCGASNAAILWTLAPVEHAVVAHDANNRGAEFDIREK